MLGRTPGAIPGVIAPGIDVAIEAMRLLASWREAATSGGRPGMPPPPMAAADIADRTEVANIPRPKTTTIVPIPSPNGLNPHPPGDGNPVELAPELELHDGRPRS